MFRFQWPATEDNDTIDTDTILTKTFAPEPVAGTSTCRALKFSLAADEYQRISTLFKKL